MQKTQPRPSAQDGGVEFLDFETLAQEMLSSAEFEQGESPVAAEPRAEGEVAAARVSGDVRPKDPPTTQEQGDQRGSLRRQSVLAEVLAALEEIDARLASLSECIKAANPASVRAPKRRQRKRTSEKTREENTTRAVSAVRLRLTLCGPGCVGCPHPHWATWRVDLRAGRRRRARLFAVDAAEAAYIARKARDAQTAVWVQQARELIARRDTLISLIGTLGRSLRVAQHSLKALPKK